MKNNNHNDQTVGKLIDFVNTVSTAEELVRCIYDDPTSGGTKSKPATIGLKAAQSIIEERKKIKEYTSIDQLLAIKGIGKDTVNDMLFSMTLTKLGANDYLLLHDEEFQQSLKEFNKDDYKTSHCTHCEEEKNHDCGCSEKSAQKTSADPFSNIGISNPNTGGISVSNPNVGITTPVNPCGGTQLNGAAFTPDQSTPIKRIRVNLVILQKEDGTGNFNEFDPEHNNALDIAEANCEWNYRNVNATGSGNGCNQLADSRVRFEFKRIYLRHETLWNIDENWTRNNGNPLRPYACPSMSSNWIWRDLYLELRDQEECNEEAITVFLVNSGVYLDDIQSQPEYVVQPQGSPTWLLPNPNYNLTNWSGHSPWVGGCSIFPSNNPHNTNRGHVILCKNSYYDYIRSSRIVTSVPNPTNWYIGSGLGTLLSHELGHLIMQQGHTGSGGCGTNMMNNGGWQRYLNTTQLSNLHRVLSTTDLRRTVLEDQPDREITSNETWDRSMKVFGDIIIRDGNTLTITCELEMPKDGRIFVERGARLDVIGGTITSRCGAWGSIELHGNSKVPHPPIADVLNGAYPSSKIDHGVVYLENAVIENAAHAISTIKYETWGANLDFGGGIVVAVDSTFRNVKRAVEFMKYDFENVSRFINCTFETDPSADLYFDHQLLAFVTMWAVNGVKFHGNTFINRDSQGAMYGLDERGRGLYSINANYEVMPIKQNGGYLRNEFVNLTVAIGADSSTTFNSNLRILHALLDNCYQGIHMRGITGARIGFVECNIGSELSNIGENYAYGIRIEGGRLIAIENSQFTNALNAVGSQYGVLMQNCVDGFNWVYGCNFTGITSGVRAGGRNNWLLVKCNRFDTRIGDLYLDRDFPTQTPGEIGFVQSFHPQFGSANNQFTSSTNNCANVGHHIHFDAFAAQTFIYLLPNASSGASFVPTCIINGTPTLFQTGFVPYCPKSIASSKKGQLKSTNEAEKDISKLMESLSKDEQKQVKLLMTVSEKLDSINSDDIDLKEMFEALSTFVKIDKAEKLISEITTSASSGEKVFEMSETMREQIKFLQNIGLIAQARLDSMNALENMLA